LAVSDVRWTVFRNSTTGRHGAVLANLGRSPVNVVGLQLAKSGKLLVEDPGAATPLTAGESVDLALRPERALFILEG
jgi:hypothetical protein